MTDLVTLDDVKLWLNITNTNSDDILTEMVTQFSDYVRTYCQRDFDQRTYTESRDGNRASVMMLRNYPVTSVTSLSINGVSVPAATSVYTCGYMFDSSRLVLQGGSIFCTGLLNVQIVYQAGYATIPTDLYRAILELISLRYRERERIGQSSKSLSGETTMFITAALTDSIKTILNKYKRNIPV